jgi:hypothetical protein
MPFGPLSHKTGKGNVSREYRCRITYRTFGPCSLWPYKTVVYLSWEFCFHPRRDAYGKSSEDLDQHSFTGRIARFLPLFVMFLTRSFCCFQSSERPFSFVSEVPQLFPFSFYSTVVWYISFDNCSVTWCDSYTSNLGLPDDSISFVRFPRLLDFLMLSAYFPSDKLHVTPSLGRPTHLRWRQILHQWC